MESSTKILRRMLDERGEVWGASDTYRLLVTSWSDASGHSWSFMEHRDGSFSKLTAYHLTPEQAIAATLGTGTCKVDVLNTGDCAGYECSEYIMHCNGCGHEFGHVLYNEDGDVWMSEPPNYCPICGRRVEQ